MFTVDTNVLVYAVDLDAGDRHHAAQALMARAARAADAVLTEQSLIEFLNVLVRKRQAPLAEATRFIRSWRAAFRVVASDSSVIEKTMALLEQHKLSVWDARLLATCAANRCVVLLSEDMQDGARYDGVTVIDPFNARNIAFIERLLHA